MKEIIGSLPDGYLAYFSNLFPALSAYIYDFATGAESLRGDADLCGYFEVIH